MVLNVLGNQILNRCPELFSCGSLLPFWTDDRPPATLGQVHNITFYGSTLIYRRVGYLNIEVVNGCKEVRRKGKVMRCSWSTEYDLIYKYAEEYHDVECVQTFCGMI